jgi:methylamine dehydrogenase heavy chain
MAGAMMLAAITPGMVARAADLPEETATVETMPEGPRDHWVALGDINPLSTLDTRVMLYDGDTGRMLGMLNTGYWSSLAFFPKSGEIVTLETYFDKGTRGERRDYAVVYDPKTLLPVADIKLPPRRMTALTQTRMAGLSDDGRFLAVSNFTPAQSISIVDIANRRFVEEVETAGCGQVYPAGPRRFAILCGDATLRLLTLDETGHVTSQTNGEAFFDPFADPVLVHAVRDGARWIFVTMDGHVQEVDISGDSARPGATWSLLSDDEREDGWRAAGVQPLAIHEKTGRLYVLMRQGGPETYEEPGDNVWVFDLRSHKRIDDFALENTTMAINVSRDDKPLLNAASLKTVIPYWSLAALSIIGVEFNELDVVKPALDVYDATDGTALRTVDHAAYFATSVMQP